MNTYNQRMHLQKLRRQTQAKIAWRVSQITRMTGEREELLATLESLEAQLEAISHGVAE